MVSEPGKSLPCGGNDCFCLDPSLLPEGCVGSCDPIHHFFNLTYASYLVLPRSILQSMPDEWQRRFVMMLDEIEARFGNFPEVGTYDVRLKDEKGRSMTDPLADYERGRRRIEPIADTGRAGDR